LSTLRYLLRVVRLSPWLFVMSNVLSIGFYGLPLLFGLILREFFDSLVAATPVDLSTQMLVALYALLISLTTVVSMGMSASDGFFGVRVMSSLQRNLFKGIMSSRPPVGGPNPGDMVNRFSQDTEAFAQPVQEGAYLIGFSVSFGTAFVIMALVNLPMAVIALAPLVVVVLATRMLQDYVQRFREATREATSQVTGSVGELVGAVQAIKIANAEGRAIQHFDILGDVRRQAFLKETVVAAALDSINLMSVTLAMGAILISGAHLMRAGTFSLGDFALFTTYVTVWPVAVFPAFFGGLLANYKRSRVSLERLFEVLPPESRDVLFERNLMSNAGGAPRISLDHVPDSGRLELLELVGLTYRHPDTDRGIENFSLRIGRGTFTVITGRIGAGKTTLLETLLGLVPADAVGASF
jgi:ATP-binding cassette subfamily B protein